MNATAIIRYIDDGWIDWWVNTCRCTNPYEWVVILKDRWIDKLMMIDEVINKVHVRVNHNYNIMQGINLRLTMYKEHGMAKNSMWSNSNCMVPTHYSKHDLEILTMPLLNITVLNKNQRNC